MAERTEISWADRTFNAWIGCTEVSVGDEGACVGCYAREMAKFRGWAQWGNHPRQRTSASNWKQPLKWNRETGAAVEAWRTNPFAREETPKPTSFVFCSSLADVFDNQVPMEWRYDLFDLIRATPNLTWLLLTKRPQNILNLYTDVLNYNPATKAMILRQPANAAAYNWPKNAAIGCTVVTQKEAKRDVPTLLLAKAALNPAFAFLSMEPLMGHVDLANISTYRWPGAEVLDALRGELRGILGEHVADMPSLDWVITGGETDQGKFKARMTHPNWERSIRDQCAEAGVAYHRKQAGEFIEAHGDERAELIRRGILCGTVEGMPMFKVGKKAAGRLLDGVIHDARPVPRA